MVQKFTKKKKEVTRMAQEREYKTGLSTSIKFSTMCKLDEYSEILKLRRADVARKIIEYFLEHNDVEDLQA